MRASRGRLRSPTIIERELTAEPHAPRRRKLQPSLDRLLNAALNKADRAALGDAAKRDIETNRYPQAPQIDPLETAFAKLSPAAAPPPTAADNRSPAGPPLAPSSPPGSRSSPVHLTRPWTERRVCAFEMAMRLRGTGHSGQRGWLMSN